MNLEELIPPGCVIERRGPGNPTINSLAYDSRAVTPGALFAAFRGVRDHGLRHLPQAVRNGAVALLFDGEPEGGWPEFSGPALLVRDARKTLALTADRFYSHPSERMDLVGITGTNGKTTTAYLLESIFNAWGKRVGVIGTIQYRYGSREFPAATTTPESVDLQQLLKAMVDEGMTHVIMEVSSHALIQSRVTGCTFRAALFTNLSRDHLDYHRDMADYFEAKSRLFDLLTGGTHGPRPMLRLSNGDDPYGRELRLKYGSDVTTYGMTPESDVSGRILTSGLNGLEILIRWEGGQAVLVSPLIGTLNAYNVLAASATALHLGIPIEKVQEGVASMRSVPGRMQLLRGMHNEVAVIDYAHTPDALEKVLNTVATFSTGRIITVFGCGGDRDRGKRPLMGRIAGEKSDILVVTSDNPRSESPRSIIEDIESGVNEAGPVLCTVKEAGSRPKTLCYFIEEDRRTAIRSAISLAAAGDVVLIAGKGHENYQIIGNERFHFDDVEEVVNAFNLKPRIT
ncbi:MAG: UDP-N-acetylmuramoyl-L-alanyl-D-glutamate--2,6-diaminopimelate ligase [Deltaproteobacteria bacterium]|nr:UDP-N-acetylmuramoyl-L-alanyl-D-glutamate--2,6-diaminopimelate ligase [Deltaproteobacteria bacterium]